MLGQDMDNLQQSLQLVDSYLLLDGANVVQVSFLPCHVLPTENHALTCLYRRREKEPAMRSLHPCGPPIKTMSR
jgi:hypothetical protein